MTEHPKTTTAVQSQQPSSLTAAPAAPRTPALAFWAVVLGITGIPAIIAGHLALSRIRKSQGRLSGKGVAIAGIAFGWLSLFIAVFVAVIAAGGGYLLVNLGKSAQHQSARDTAKALGQAIEDYQKAYGKLPFSEVKLKAQGVVSDGAVMKVLSGGEVNAESNPEGRVFYSESPEIFLSHLFSGGAQDGSLKDPWGRLYHVNPVNEDLDGDEIIDHFTVISEGPDKTLGTADDIRSK